MFAQAAAFAVQLALGADPPVTVKPLGDGGRAANTACPTFGVVSKVKLLDSSHDIIRLSFLSIAILGYWVQGPVVVPAVGEVSWSTWAAALQFDAVVQVVVHDRMRTCWGPVLSPAVAVSFT